MYIVLFKYALTQYRLEERSITSTNLAYHMQSHEFNDFWKEIRKQNKAKSALSNCVAGVTGETAIADMWISQGRGATLIFFGIWIYMLRHVTSSEAASRCYGGLGACTHKNFF